MLAAGPEEQLDAVLRIDIALLFRGRRGDNLLVMHLEREHEPFRLPEEPGFGRLRMRLGCSRHDKVADRRRTRVARFVELSVESELASQIASRPASAGRLLQRRRRPSRVHTAQQIALFGS